MNYSADTPPHPHTHPSSLQEIIGTIRLLALLSAPLICIQVSREIPRAFCIAAENVSGPRAAGTVTPFCIVDDKLQ